MPEHSLGELAALGAAACWAVSALVFEAAGRRIGTLTLNLIRLVMALGMLSLATWATRGLLLPLDATPRMWLWLGASGLVGFTFGDLCLFRAYVEIGPRLGTLSMPLVPLFTAALGWLLLRETLTPRDGWGMVLTVLGIAWAVLDRNAHRPPLSEQDPAAPRRAPLRGLLLALGGAVGQAVGLVLSKIGMGSYPALATAQVRVTAGLLGYVVLFFVLRRWGRVHGALRDGLALTYSAAGALFGPVIGVSLALVAVRHTVAGVAATLMALTPILVIPLVYLVRREKAGWGGLGGAAMAVSGAALLLL